MTLYKIELAWEGEGWCGDYDQDDPDDQQLMRFSLMEQLEDGTWQQVEDCSYCTQLVLSDMLANDGHYQKLAEDTLLREFELASPGSFKKRAESLSWISLKDLQFIERNVHG